MLSLSTMLATTKVLFNDCYGGFGFSDAFLKEYNLRTGAFTDEVSIHIRVGNESIRCNPVVIAIFEEKGSEWCSGPHSSLAVREFPAIFEKYWEIEEYDGNEHVRILFNEALADVLHTYVASGDHATMKRQYTAIMDAKKLVDADYQVHDSELKKELQDGTDYGYTYFGVEDAPYP